MKFVWLRKITDTIDRITYQGEFEYDFGYDVAQKITFVLTLLILWGLPWSWGEYQFAMFIFCCIVGRVVVMSILHHAINDKVNRKHKDKRFLNMSQKTWKFIVFVILTYITIKDMLQPRSVGDFFLTLPGWLVMYFCGFFIFAGQTGLTQAPSDPNKIGSAAWKRANGVVKVNRDLMRPLYRDKYGNYYEGTGFVPVAAPVNITNKDRK